MAAADSLLELAGLSMCNRLERIVEASSKPRQPSSEATLLCNKLDTLKQEQEASRLKRDNPDAVREGCYLPSSRTVRTSIAEKSALMSQVPNVCRGSTHVPGPALPCNQLPSLFNVSKDHSHTIDAVPPCHSTTEWEKSLQVDMQSSSPFSTEKDGANQLGPPWRAFQDDQNERNVQGVLVATDGERDKHTDCNNVPASPKSKILRRECRTSSRCDDSAQSTGLVAFASPKWNVSQYRPGDAAKRRSVSDAARKRSVSGFANASTTDTGNELPLKFHNIPKNTRVSKFLESDTPIDDSASESSDFRVMPTEPSIVTLDYRADVRRKSQPANEVKHTLHLFHKADRRTNSVCEGTKKRLIMLEPTNLVPVTKVKAENPPKVYRGPQNEHMIADAVRIIKQGERLKRRQSIVGFFRKLEPAAPARVDDAVGFSWR